MALFWTPGEVQIWYFQLVLLLVLTVKTQLLNKKLLQNSVACKQESFISKPFSWQWKRYKRATVILHFYSDHVEQYKSHGQVQGQGTELQKSQDWKYEYWEGWRIGANNVTYTNMQKYLIYCFRNSSYSIYYFMSVFLDDENSVGSPSYKYINHLRRRTNLYRNYECLF